MRSSYSATAIITTNALLFVACLACVPVNAQGDASLPPPEPGYRRRNAAQFGNGNRANEGGFPGATGQVEQTGGNDEAGAIRRRWRQRINQNVNGAPGRSVDVRQGPAADFRQGAGGERPFAGRRQNAFRKNRLGADSSDGIAPGARLRRMQGMGGGGILGKAPLDFSSLNLSEEQKQRIKQVHQENGVKTKEIRQSLVAKRSELKDLMFDPSATDDQIRAKRRELRHFQDRVEEMQINDFLSIRSVLNPEQRQKFGDLKPGGPKLSGNPQMVAPVVENSNKD